MKWKIEFTKKFLNAEQKLPKEIRDRIIIAVKQVSENPYNGIPLVGILKGLWKKRVGKYRIVYLINNDEGIITFINVDLRKRIYKR